MFFSFGLSSRGGCGVVMVARLGGATRRGFTLLELLVVISVMIALAAITIPTLGYLRNSAKRAATAAIVDALCAAIDAYQLKSWNVFIPDPLNPAKGKQTTYRLWDWNGDQILDGYPEKEKTGITSVSDPDYPLYNSGYRGFFDMAHPTITARNLNEKGQVVDAWGVPLHIAFAVDIYGASGFGVWSTGPDKQDGPAASSQAADNITSWKNRND